jgi:hypothetical protein
MSLIAVRRVVASIAARSVVGRGTSFVSQNAAVSTRIVASRVFSTMDHMETGTKMYMSLYPEGSTDGALRLGNIVPDFAADTTHGRWESFHEWKKGECPTSFK